MTEDQPLSTKVEKEDGTTAYAAIDGKEYKTRAGAWKRSQKLMDQGLANDQEAETTIPINEEPSSSGPSWAAFDLEDVAEGVQVIPGALKSIRRSEPGGRKSKKELELMRESSKSILKMGYRTGDVVLTRYGVAVLDDPEYLVTHSEADYEWISDITQSFLDDRGLNVAAFIGPGGMAALANTYWFGKPVMDIRSKAGKPILPKISGGRNIFRRIGARIPFLRRRAKKKFNEDTIQDISSVVEDSFND